MIGSLPSNHPEPEPNYLGSFLGGLRIHDYEYLSIGNFIKNCLIELIYNPTNTLVEWQHCACKIKCHWEDNYDDELEELSDYYIFSNTKRQAFAVRVIIICRTQETFINIRNQIRDLGYGEDFGYEEEVIKNNPWSLQYVQ